jgi:hypothetical protein
MNKFLLTIPIRVEKLQFLWGSVMNESPGLVVFVIYTSWHRNVSEMEKAQGLASANKEPGPVTGHSR